MIWVVTQKNTMSTCAAFRKYWRFGSDDCHWFSFPIGWFLGFILISWGVEKKTARYRWFWKKTRLGYSKNRSPSIHGMARVLHSTGLLSPWFWCEQSHDSEWSFRRCFFYHYSRNPDINLPDLTIKHTNYPVILRILGFFSSSFSRKKKSYLAP